MIERIYNMEFISPEGLTYKGRAKTSQDYVILHPETLEEIHVSRWTLIRKMGFKSAKGNSKNRHFTRTPRIFKEG